MSAHKIYGGQSTRQVFLQVLAFPPARGIHLYQRDKRERPGKSFFRKRWALDEGPEGEWRYRSTLLYLNARCGGWSKPPPGRFTPGREIRYIFYRRLCGLPGPVWTGVEKFAPMGLDPRTVQPVASCYTDYIFTLFSLQRARVVHSLRI